MHIRAFINGAILSCILWTGIAYAAGVHPVSKAKRAYKMAKASPPARFVKHVIRTAD